MRKVRLAIINDMGNAGAFIKGTETRLGTPYGPSPTLTIGRVGDIDVVYMPRQEEGHKVPPHKINNRANIFALHSLGVERILATNIVSALNPKYKLGSIVVPSDFVDFTKSGPHTFYEEAPVTHIDASALYCPELQKILVEAARKETKNVWGDAVYACREGPRYESPAEARMFRTLGCDIVGMVGLPEAALAHELEMCYAAMCLVSGMAAGMQDKISAEIIAEKSKALEGKAGEILRKAIADIPKRRGCVCSNALEGARV